MGNEILGKTEDNTEHYNDENDDLFNEKENKLILNYKVDSPGQKIRLVGSRFYENNKDNCKICVEFIVKNLAEFFKLKKKKVLLVLL